MLGFFSQPGENSGDNFVSAKKRETEKTEAASIESFARLMSRNPLDVSNAIQEIQRNWHPGSTIMLFETGQLARSRGLMERIVWLAESKTGEAFGTDAKEWYRWLWNQESNPHPQYAEFKSNLYSRIDPSFARYFEHSRSSTIRLDEIMWGGVKRDGIPPLNNPKMEQADDVPWLDDSNIVFGVVINGQARCYPKRILAWHEMFKDSIGGESVCGVY